MAHEPEQDVMAARRREWDQQSIYLRLQDGIPTAFWVWGDLIAPLEPRPELFAHDGDFGWGQQDATTQALAVAIVAKLVEVGLVAPEQLMARAHYLHDEVLSKLPAGEHYDLHLSYLRLLLG
ncbi:MAG: hypothetical protein RR721_02235 [Aeromonas sp.]|uniref:hypothetical protein n=1 Tax=Aeromonas sp. TaxID=647 RepID=UPI002FC5AE13